jgi:hypothetical protein
MKQSFCVEESKYSKVYIENKLLGKLSRPERGELTAELRNVNKTGKLMND